MHLRRFLFVVSTRSPSSVHCLKVIICASAHTRKAGKNLTATSASEARRYGMGWEQRLAWLKWGNRFLWNSKFRREAWYWEHKTSGWECISERNQCRRNLTVAEREVYNLLHSLVTGGNYNYLPLYVRTSVRPWLITILNLHTPAQRKRNMLEHPTRKTLHWLYRTSFSLEITSFP